MPTHTPQTSPPSAAAPVRPSPDRLLRARQPRPGAGPTPWAEFALRQSALRDRDAARLRAELVAVHRPGCPPRIILSLKSLTLLAAPCVATLTEVAQALAPMGGSLVLCDVPDPVARMLKTTGLARTLRVAKSRDHARKLLGGAKSAPQAA